MLGTRLFFVGMILLALAGFAFSQSANNTINSSTYYPYQNRFHPCANQSQSYCFTISTIPTTSNSSTSTIPSNEQYQNNTNTISIIPFSANVGTTTLSSTSTLSSSSTSSYSTTTILQSEVKKTMPFTEIEIIIVVAIVGFVVFWWFIKPAIFDSE